MKCLCENSALQAEATHCVKTSCFSRDDQESAYRYAVAVCGQVGIRLPPFDDIGKRSDARRVEFGYWGVLGAIAVGLLNFGGY